VGLAAAGGWGETVITLPAVRDELTGVTHDGDTRVADLLATYPVALLVKVG
jgi:(1->4)-alpha-D-glucan 1-alpha-D-glucosylmutase